MAMMNVYLTQSDLARLLKLSPATIQRRRFAGQLPNPDTWYGADDPRPLWHPETIDFWRWAK